MLGFDYLGIQLFGWEYFEYVSVVVQCCKGFGYGGYVWCVVQVGIVCGMNYGVIVVWYDDQLVVGIFDVLYQCGFQDCIGIDDVVCWQVFVQEVDVGQWFG